MFLTNDFSRVARELAQGRAADLPCRAEGKTFVRRFVPEERLIVLGGGHIAQPLCAAGAMLDYAVTVVDDRPEFANDRRFPAAAQVLCGEYEPIIQSLQIRPGDYVCVITRGHRWDRECLRAVLRGTPPAYLGLISSLSRACALKELLQEEGFDRAAVDAIHAPIGLSIGAITPAEIAISICAQLVERRRAQPSRTKISGLLAQSNTDPVFLRFMAENRCPRAVILVLAATGSTPVKSGAIMAVDGQGRGYGTIGGGWGEARAMALGRKLIGTGAEQIISIAMDDDVAGEDGLVCGGTMRVLIADAT